MLVIVSPQCISWNVSYIVPKVFSSVKQLNCERIYIPTQLSLL